jgi:hypothetical protein
MIPLEPDRDQIEIFVDAALRHRGMEGFISLRSFFHEDGKPPFRTSPVPLKGNFKYLIDFVEDDARRAAQAPQPVVFAPPLSVFSNDRNAREADMLAGLVLSVECDQNPHAARCQLEEILGPATVVVRSGGIWINEDGEIHDKLHLHWRLKQPARSAEDLKALKGARASATRLVGGDSSNNPVCHPIRWPGSWHRKSTPRLCTIVAVNPDVEIVLTEALAALPPPPDVARQAHTTEDWLTFLDRIYEGSSRGSALARYAGLLTRTYPCGCSMRSVASRRCRLTRSSALSARLPNVTPTNSTNNSTSARVSMNDAFQNLQDARQRCSKIRVDSLTTEGTPEAVTLADFYAYMPMHSYIYTPSREPWPAASVNARIPPVALMRNGKAVLDNDGEQVKQSASAWLDKNKPVEQMTWAPGLPMIIADRLVSAGGWIERRGVSCFNLYRPPEIKPGDAGKAGPWLEHARNIYGEQAQHMILWLAHRVQRPQEKINHALVLGGSQGIGKDTMLEPVKRAVGPWNFSEVSPQHMFGRFNGYLKSVILRVSEARDLGDVNRFSFYDHMKAYTAAPPDALRVDEKNLREYSVLNCCGVIITTNHKADGIFLPSDDRRHYVAWSDRSKECFDSGYWNTLWGWYESGGYGHVAAYLAALGLKTFDAKAPPPKTSAFWDIVDANRASEDAELADVLDSLGNPAATTLARVQNASTGDFEVWIRDRKHRRQIPYRFEQCGYVPVRHETAKDGLWVINKKRQVVYAKASLSLRKRLAAAQEL